VQNEGGWANAVYTLHHCNKAEKTIPVIRLFMETFDKKLQPSEGKQNQKIRLNSDDAVACKIW
jgi:hypothetical protein